MVENKSTQIKNKVGLNMITIERKKKLSIPKNLNLITCWNIIGPELADEFEGGYTHIPFFLDTNAYQIGYIFVPIESKINCLCVTEEIVKILGPLSDFVVKDQTNEEIIDSKRNLSRRQPDAPNLRLILGNKKKEIIFTGYDCEFLDKSTDTIFEDLTEAKWFGLITGVFTAQNFELNSTLKLFSRITYIGDGMHTVLFKYEICEINENGLVTKTGGKVTQPSMIPLHVLHLSMERRHNTGGTGGWLLDARARRTHCVYYLRGGPARDSWNHASMNPLKE
ncbi:hypothetical protein M0802_010915 [Mischocyttarus mexicanus]|nr:hypothetical protein M0802_010915 [Mischocyttarus mexicanus]